MSEIEVGEYIRTTDGEIEKVVLIYDNRYMNEDGNMTHFDDIKAHSKNIIDLIEVGDYVNGYKVDSIENGKLIIGDTTQVVEQILDDNEDIKTILTHEQFEQNSYKVVE